MELWRGQSISVEYMDVFISRSEKTACVILRAADNDKAIGLFHENGSPVLGPNGI